MNTAIALGAVVVQWCAGALFAYALLARVACRRTTVVLGAGFFVGAVLNDLLFHTLDALGVPFTRVGAGVAYACVLAVGILLAAKTPRSGVAPEARAAASPGRRWLEALLLAMICARFGSLAIETLTLPMFPWDAWAQWATKAKVWLATQRLATFVEPAAWLAATPGSVFTDANPAYPPLVPLQQVWVGIVIGGWDETLVNVPWLACFVALLLLFHGAVREFGGSRLVALAGVYALSSLPLFGVHVALAGYADLYMAGFIFLALSALVVGERLAFPWLLCWSALFAAMLPLVKRPGIGWMLLVLAATVFAIAMRAGAGRGARWQRRAPAALTIVAAAALLSAFVLGGDQARGVYLAVIENVFLLDNWHLAGLASLLAVVALVRDPPPPALAAVFAFTVVSLTGMVVAFAVTGIAGSIIDATTTNRALMHLMPVALLVVVGAASRLDTPPIG